MVRNVAVLALTASAATAIQAATANTDVQVQLSNKHPILFDTNGSGPLDVGFAPMYYLNGTYRWIGASTTCPIGTPCGLRSYASVNLMDWNDEGIFADYSSPVFAACAGACGRPHIIYNGATSKYVLWANADLTYYTWTADHPLGPYTFIGQVNTHGPSGDFTVRELGGVGYISYSAFNFAASGFIWPPFDQAQVLQQLTPDYTGVTGPTYTIRTAANDQLDRSQEAPDLFERNGIYYMTASPTCGNCNDAPLLVYRSTNLTSNIWKRQIISGDTCGGQTAGVLIVPDSAGNCTYLHSADLWPGYGPVSLHGKNIQPLSFRPDGSLRNLDCNVNSNFTFNAIRGAGEVNSGRSADFTDSSGADALYEYTCDLNQFNIYQTWQNSKTGTLQEVGINMGATDQTNTFYVAIFRFKSNQDFFTPSTQFDLLFTTTLNSTQTPLGSALLKLHPPATTTAHVTSGDRLGIALTGLPGAADNVGNYCYLSKEADAAFDVDASTRTLFYNLAGDTSPRGKSGMLSPVKVRAREISWYSVVV